MLSTRRRPAVIVKTDGSFAALVVVVMLGVLSYLLDAGSGKARQLRPRLGSWCSVGGQTNWVSGAAASFLRDTRASALDIVGRGPDNNSVIRVVL